MCLAARRYLTITILHRLQAYVMQCVLKFMAFQTTYVLVSKCTCGAVINKANCSLLALVENLRYLIAACKTRIILPIVVQIGEQLFLQTQTETRLANYSSAKTIYRFSITCADVYRVHSTSRYDAGTVQKYMPYINHLIVWRSVLHMKLRTASRSFLSFSTDKFKLINKFSILILITYNVNILIPIVDSHTHTHTHTHNYSPIW